MRPALTWSVVELRLKHVFTIARGSRSVVPVVIVRYTREGITGVGEASPLARYGESVESVTAFLGRIAGSFSDGSQHPDVLLNRLAESGPGDAAARAGVDTAVHDWIGKRAGVPLWKHFGLSRGPVPSSSITIGMDSPDVVERKVAEAAAFAAIKVKMGMPGERDLVTAVRKLTSKPIRVDANEGWKTREGAIGHLSWLEGLGGVELVEQPLPAGNPDAAAWLKERTAIPIFADEDVRGFEDLKAIAGAYDGVNVKLMKSAGLGEMKRTIDGARTLGMNIMIGCMIETSVGVSAAAQLSPAADLTDLDGCLLVDNDPFSGVVGSDGVIRLGSAPGIGVGGVEA